MYVPTCFCSGVTILDWNIVLGIDFNSITRENLLIGNTNVLSTIKVKTPSYIKIGLWKSKVSSPWYFNGPNTDTGILS